MIGLLLSIAATATSRMAGLEETVLITKSADKLVFWQQNPGELRNQGTMNRRLQSTAARRSETVPAAEIAVEWLETDINAIGAAVAVSRFTGAGGTVECHVTVALNSDVPDPLPALLSAWHAALDTAGISPASTVMHRVFCSDPANRISPLPHSPPSIPGACSMIGQTPLAGGKLALWSQHIIDPDGPLDSTGGGMCFSVTRGSIRHHWFTGLCATGSSDAYSETLAMLAKHNQWLADHDMTLAKDVVRTWWFVRNIDADYQGLVDARRELFAAHGLTENTHYIASTGIAGTPRAPGARLSLDSHAIAGLEPAQIKYLSAPQHLNPTHAYGVTFERATAISYSDRRHVFLSGTASIDSNGDIVHPGDLARQLDRTIENISALLAAAGAGLQDLAMILVYLRDPADGKRTEQLLTQRFPNLPMILLHAPVCRSGWLIEIEGIAMIAIHAPGLSAF